MIASTELSDILSEYRTHNERFIKERDNHIEKYVKYMRAWLFLYGRKFDWGIADSTYCRVRVIDCKGYDDYIEREFRDDYAYLRGESRCHTIPLEDDGLTYHVFRGEISMTHSRDMENIISYISFLREKYQLSFSPRKINVDLEHIRMERYQLDKDEQRLHSIRECLVS